jgi:hypothetical protein
MNKHHGYAIEMARERHEQIKANFQASRRIRPAERRRWRDRVTLHRAEATEFPSASVQSASAT